jgi:hypothetical protein
MLYSLFELEKYLSFLEFIIICGKLSCLEEQGVSVFRLSESAILIFYDLGINICKYIDGCSFNFLRKMVAV